MKKRYQVTLTVKNVEKFQKLANELNMGQNAMSRVFDDQLVSITQTLGALYGQAKKRGKVTMADMFQVIADEFERQGVSDEDAPQKKVSKRAAVKN